jgi:hypothetical protein
MVRGAIEERRKRVNRGSVDSDGAHAQKHTRTYTRTHTQKNKHTHTHTNKLDFSTSHSHTHAEAAGYETDELDDIDVPEPLEKGHNEARESYFERHMSQLLLQLHARKGTHTHTRVGTFVRVPLCSCMCICSTLEW